MNEEKILRMDEINVRIILKDLFRNLLIIILAAAIALMGVRIYKNIVYVPEYTANSTMAVMAKGNADKNAYSSLTTATSMAEVFAEVFQSDVLKEKVEESMGEIPGKVKIHSSLIPETNLLELKVTAQDPQTAYRVIQGILENYKYVSDYLFGNAILEVITDPEVPVVPSNHFDTSRLDTLGVLAALVLVCGAIILCSIFRPTVKTIKSGKRNLEGRYLASVPFEVKNRTLKGKIKQTNKAVLLSSPVVNFEFEESFHRLASNLEYLMSKNGHQTILLTSVAENEGKSTVCVNLAIALAKRNKKVLVIDSDFKKPAIHKLLGHTLHKENGALKEIQRTASIRHQIQYNKKLNLHVIFNAQSIENCQRDLKPELLTQLLSELKGMFDYIILDSAPVSVGTDTEYLMDFVDCTAMVVREDMVRISDINDTSEMLKEGRSKYLGYVLNAFNTKEMTHHSRYGYGYKYGNGKSNRYDTRSEE